MKKRLLIVAFISIFIILIYIIFIGNRSVHQPISAQNIEKLEYWGSNGFFNKSTQIEKVQFAKWFNSISEIRLNKDFAGTTCESGVIIKLKSGKEILILDSGKNFEIQRNDVKLKNISYWGKQSEIEKLLNDLSSSEKVK